MFDFRYLNLFNRDHDTDIKYWRSLYLCVVCSIYQHSTALEQMQQIQILIDVNQMWTNARKSLIRSIAHVFQSWLHSSVTQFLPFIFTVMADMLVIYVIVKRNETFMSPRSRTTSETLIPSLSNVGIEVDDTTWERGSGALQSSDTLRVVTHTSRVVREHTHTHTHTQHCIGCTAATNR